MLSDAKKYPRYLMLLVAFSIILKLLVFCLLLYLGADFTLPDSPSYLDPAQAFLNHGEFWNNKGLWMRTPLYPLIISGVYWFFANNIFYVIFLQIFLSAILVVNAYRITELLSHSKVAIIAAALVSIDYLYISYANLIMSDLLFAVLFSFVFYYAIQFIQSKNISALFAVGLLLALATLLRPVSYYLTPILAVALFVYLAKTQNIKKALKLALIVMVPSLVLVGGWQLRNKAVIGTYQYTNIDAVNLYHYYAADNLSHMQGISVQQAQEQLSKQASKQSLTGIARYDYYRSEGLKILLHNPGWSLVQFVSGLVRTVFGNDYILLFYNNSFFLHGKELENYFFNHHYLALIKAMTWGDLFKLSVMTGFFVFNFIVVVSACYYVYQSLRNQSKSKSSLILVLIILGYFLLVSSNYCSQARFRLPFEIILDCFAVIGCYSYVLKRKQAHTHSCEKLTYENVIH